MKFPEIINYHGIRSASSNLLCAIDCETSGTEAGYHEILQLAIQPLDENFKPYENILPFYVYLKPDYPERATRKALQVNGMDLENLKRFGVSQEKCHDLLIDWYNSLKLSSSRRLLPLAQNWPFDYSFLNSWLGPDLFGEIFAPHYRDTMELALIIADLHAMGGSRIPFNAYNLKSLCSFFGVTYSPESHDALEDALAASKVYPLELNFLRHLLN